MKRLIFLAAFLIATPAVALPAPPTWSEKIDAYLAKNLKDPYTAVKSLDRGPRYGAVKYTPAAAWAGWSVCYSINAKNSYGAFVGSRTYLFVVREEGVEGVLVDDGNPYTAGVISKECSRPADEEPVSSSTTSQATPAERPPGS